MAHKSKTQRAKATAAKANRRDREERDAIAAERAPETTEGAEEKKPKKVRFQFLRDVRAEMKRVTWPSRQDVIRWSGVVVGALIFFGVYVAILDNLIITPGLVALSGLGA